MSFHSSLSFASLANQTIRAAALITLLSLASTANAVTLFWDADSNLQGSGAWDANITQNWKTTNTAGAPDSKWTPNDGTLDASFGGTLSAPAQDGTGSPNGQVTVSGTINVDSIILAPAAGTYALSGGTLHITNATNSIVMNSNASGTARAQVIASQITGTDISVFADSTAGSVNSLLTLGASGTGVTNTFTGDLIFAGPSTATVGLSQININNPTALPSTATVRMKRNISQLLFGAGGASGSQSFTATVNNNINLNDGATNTLTQSIGVFNLNSVITLGGVISGNAGLTFQLGNGGGQGKIILTNHATYTGPTQINTAAAKTGIVALGVNNALPIGTTFTESRGNFDMAGFNQQVGGLSGSGGNGVVSNTSATLSTLTISGSVIGDYSGLIGATSSAFLPGATDNVALVLASTNTGSLSLSNTLFSNTYNGGTTISGGKLYANSDATSGYSSTGTGSVTVNGTGFLAGSGGVGGPITVASGGHISGGQRSGNLIGTLTAFNSVTLATNSNLDIDLGAPDPSASKSDQIAVSNIFGNFPLNVPAAAHTVGVNFTDPNGGQAGNGTYTLMTFQPGQYTGSSNASQFFTASTPTPNSLNGATIAYHLADSSNNIVDGTPASATRVIATITGGPNALLWTGANNGNWNTGGDANFKNQGTGVSTNFAGNDNVTFDDTGANTDPVTIAAGGVQPNVITVDNSTATYTFSGGDIKGSTVGGTGGLILKGTAAVTINSNYSSAGPITSSKTTAAGTVTINGNITAATSLTLNSGVMTLAGANTYTGTTTVNGGTLTANGTSATFGKGDLNVTAGHAAIAAGVADAIGNSAKLTLAGGGTANMADVGYIDLAAGINETIAQLVLGTTSEPAGTYGSSTSGATHVFDDYFSGTGIITVIAAALAGDYNHDGKVSAADYVVWKNGGSPNPNSPADYTTWKSNFGNSAGGGAGLASNAVPEPTTLALSILAMIGLRSRRRRS